jgi:hypothetical protein
LFKLRGGKLSNLYRRLELQWMSLRNLPHDDGGDGVVELWKLRRRNILVINGLHFLCGLRLWDVSKQHRFIKLCSLCSGFLFWCDGECLFELHGRNLRAQFGHIRMC